MFRFSRSVLSSVCSIGLFAAVSAPTFAAPKSPVGVSSYTVVAGDYLFGIAARLHVSLTKLLDVNGLELSSLILPGERLRVPVPPPSVATPLKAGSATSLPLVYVVVSGDFLFGIADRLGVSVRQLLAANDLVLNSLIYPGMRLAVPPGGTLPSVPPAPSTPPVKNDRPSKGVVSDVRLPSQPDVVKYTVVAGDSLYAIAARFEVGVKSLLAVNQLSLSSVIYPGLVLSVPKVSPVKPVVAPSDVAARSGVVAFAVAQLGKPYRAYTAGPATFDCSGLTLAAYAAAGVTLPHYSAAQVAFGRPIDWTVEKVVPGDLVFLEPAEGAGVVSHVGIATSGSTWIQAPRTGAVVREGNIVFDRVIAVRRLFG